MHPLIRSVIAIAILSLTLSTSSAYGDPIITIYTSQSDLLALIPPGEDPEDYVLAREEFEDPVFDSGVTLVPDAGADCGGTLTGWWCTTGPVSFTLDSGSAYGFVFEYQPLAPGQPVPMVSLTRTDGASFNVGPLVGGPFEDALVFGFTSTEPFNAVSLDLESLAPFSTDVAVFFDVPGTAVPEPTTWLLLATGVAAASGRRWRRYIQG